MGVVIPISLSPLTDDLVFPADHAGEELVLGWRRVNEDFSSRDGFRWPQPGGWSERVKADRFDTDCSYGLHIATTWAGASAGGVVSTVLIVAYRPGDVAHVSLGKVRVDQALVLAVVDVPALARAGWLAGTNLREANLTRADLRWANLTRADLWRANFVKANLREANLREANLVEANLRRAKLTGADLREANLRWANLREANLVEANLTRADLREANLVEANLREANLRWANLRWANLREANLREANLTGAKLTGADLREANLTRADLREADLTRADLSGVVADVGTVWPDGFNPAAAGVTPR